MSKSVIQTVNTEKNTVLFAVQLEPEAPAVLQETEVVQQPPQLPQPPPVTPLEESQFGGFVGDGATVMSGDDLFQKCRFKDTTFHTIFKGVHLTTTTALSTEMLVSVLNTNKNMFYLCLGALVMDSTSLHGHPITYLQGWARTNIGVPIHTAIMISAAADTLAVLSVLQQFTHRTLTDVEQAHCFAALVDDSLNIILQNENPIKIVRKSLGRNRHRNKRTRY